MSKPSLLILSADRQIDRRILQEADSLEASGYTVRILSMPNPEAKTDTDPRIHRVEVSAEKNGAKLSLLLAAYRKLCQKLPMNGFLLRSLRDLAWSFISKPDRFYLSLFSPYLGDFKADMVLAADLPMLPVGRYFAEQYQAKLIYDSHELYTEQGFSKSVKRIWTRIESQSIKATDAVITVNPSIAAELQSRYQLDKVAVLYNAVNPCHSAPVPRLFHQHFGFAAERKILLFQGGLSAGRDLDSLVKAAGYFKNPNLALVILGDGQFGLELRKQVQDHQLEDRVYFHAAVPQDQLLAYSQSADLGVIPYQPNCLNNYYCTPNKLFEFIAAGLPILASPLPELQAIIEGQGIGCCLDLSSPQQIAKAVEQIFADEDRLPAYRAALKSAQQCFNWDNESKKLLQIVEELQCAS